LTKNYESWDRRKKKRAIALIKEKQRRKSTSDLLEFTKFTFRKFQCTQFHKTYYTILDKFTKGEIKKLIISIPPQHGKSEGSSRRLPAYMVGKNPDLKVALISYEATLAQRFGKDIHGIMSDEPYKKVFDARLADKSDIKSNTNQIRQVANGEGWLKFIGVGGPLTGDPVDLLIMDDLYKGYAEANSEAVSNAAWTWYTSVGDTRLHNDSQQLIVFTRWSENDLVGRLEAKGEVQEISSVEEIELIDPEKFIKVNIPAIKEDEPTPLDPRQKDEPLYPEKHSIEKLKRSRARDPQQFTCIYQGDPLTKEGLMYREFKTYTELPPAIITKSYTDVADQGKDYLCHIDYIRTYSSDLIYVIDVYYTQEDQGTTIDETALRINKWNVNESWIESNNGGRGFHREVEKQLNPNNQAYWFHQSANKESRIFSNSASVNNRIVFPHDWHVRWPEFYTHVTKFKKDFTSKYDDAPDTMTGIVEKEETPSFDYGISIS